MRHLVTSFVSMTVLLMTGCSSSDPVPADGVDINAAAQQAQRSINAYSADAGQPGKLSGGSTSNGGESGNVATPADEIGSGNDPEPLSPPAPGTPGGLPDDRTPLSESPFTPDSAQGAANVVQTYFALLGEGKYRRAWALWDDDGKASGQSPAGFAASFARYREYHANVGGPGRIDAGAGQRYVTVPVQVYARLKQGAKPFYQRGSVTLHRVADIDGATPAQRRWRISRADFNPVPGRKQTTAPAAPRSPE